MCSPTRMIRPYGRISSEIVRLGDFHGNGALGINHTKGQGLPRASAPEEALKLAFRNAIVAVCRLFESRPVEDPNHSTAALYDAATLEVPEAQLSRQGAAPPT